MNKFLLILLLLASTATSAALIKWVDANGQIHYSDQPAPANVKATTLRSSSDAVDSGERDDMAASAPAASSKTIAEREAEWKKSQQEKKTAADKTAKEQADLEAFKASCAAAQQNLATLQGGLRIMEIDANGERSYIDEAQRQKKIEKVQQDINRYCK